MTERTSLFELCTDDSAELRMFLLKSKLVVIISMEINARGWNQTQAAKHLQTTQPRVSNLLQGRLMKFSVDYLLNCLSLLGIEYDIQVKGTS